MAPARAVVFGYHDVGVRCLQALLSAGLSIPLVVTSADDPTEARWFGSMEATAREYGLTVVTDHPASPQLTRRVRALSPEFIFSFYYRSLLGPQLLQAATRGALNVHGSLLPKYRGRAPVNWAILHGERETGATLHYMVERADAGDIVDQLAVPILDNDDAREVFHKVTVAAETIVARSVPGLIAGTAPRQAQRLEPGQYFGRRRPQDGEIDWSKSAAEIHNLVRAVAPPFPGAFTTVGNEKWWIHKTRREGAVQPVEPAWLYGKAAQCFVACRDGGVLRIVAAANAAGPIDLRERSAVLERQPQPLG